jgi:hypothetical protein
MGGMKKGSGNLDFGEEDDNSDKSPEPESSEEHEESEATSTEVETDETVDGPEGDDAGRPDASTTTEETKSNSSEGSSRYPYFVRRSNVGDERDNRLELFARDEVVSQESEFRSQLASELGADDIAKTDAREYALLAAFNNVEEVAELMREDGYGELD